MKYQPLLSIRLKHPYYRDGLCPDFTVTPDPETASLLNNHRCVFKDRPFGLDIWAPAQGQRAAIPFATESRCCFGLTLANPEFALFTGDTVSVAGQDGITLSQSGKELDGGVFDPAVTQSPMLAVSVQRDFNQLQATAQALDVSFSGKQLHWAYYLVADSGKAKDFTISDTGSKTEWQSLAAVVDDGVFQQLQQRYPRNDVACFVSPQAILCQASGGQDLQLKLAGSVVQERLPSPTYRNRGKLAVTGQTLAVHYTILKYCSNLTT